MTTNESDCILTEAQRAYEAARELARISPTAENREAVKAAWAAREAAAPKQKVSSYASRAGKRQRAEMRGGK